MTCRQWQAIGGIRVASFRHSVVILSLTDKILCYTQALLLPYIGHILGFTSYVADLFGGLRIHSYGLVVCIVWLEQCPVVRHLV